MTHEEGVLVNDPQDLFLNVAQSRRHVLQHLRRDSREFGDIVQNRALRLDQLVVQDVAGVVHQSYPRQLRPVLRGAHLAIDRNKLLRAFFAPRGSLPSRSELVQVAKDFLGVGEGVPDRAGGPGTRTLPPVVLALPIAGTCHGVPVLFHLLGGQSVVLCGALDLPQGELVLVRHLDRVPCIQATLLLPVRHGQQGVHRAQRVNERIQRKGFHSKKAATFSLCLPLAGL
mmetsp:Transcript_5228/g.15724  ORF Transcript_5228/g.15724 Transcript_5228/m.15724 type:complete len:228 (-) Transcript_5228:2324-3007(-)